MFSIYLSESSNLNIVDQISKNQILYSIVLLFLWLQAEILDTSGILRKKDL